MTTAERSMLTLTLVFGMLALSVAAGRAVGWSGGDTPSAHAASGTLYGANETWVTIATAEWPQQRNNWCGIANIEVVANYTFQLVNGQNFSPFNGGGQKRIANDLDSNFSVSPWGTPSWNGEGPGSRADIARDGGTDPRSLAWGIFYESAAGAVVRSEGAAPGPTIIVPTPVTPTYTFHDVIYHNDVTHAVGGMARTLERYQMPLSVTVAHGLHSDIVSGVYANNDPIQSYPADVDAVNVWDPAVGTPSGGYQSAREVTWAGYTFNTNVYMWGSTYSANNGYDPDPAVGIYTPNSQYPSHWINYRTDIEPDTLITIPANYAVDENGNVMYHP
jgi:hypothetical protein